MNGNNKRYLPNGRKGMQNPGEIEDMKKKIYGLSGPMAVEEDRLEAVTRNLAGEKEEQKNE